MSKMFPIQPANPHRICWGCDKYCHVDSMACANERSPHPIELFGEDWMAWGDRQLDPLANNGQSLPQTLSNSATKPL